MNHRIALLDSAGKCLSVALWDGVSAWDPVQAGLCASTQDVTSAPQVGPGWTQASGGWSAPAPPAPTPNPAGFLRAVALDTTISLAARNAMGPWLFGLSAALSVEDVALISTQWTNLVAGLPIGTADHAAIVAHSNAYAIPGIS